jgi:peptide-methionine (S)-S-oxide reductase
VRPDNLQQGNVEMFRSIIRAFAGALALAAVGTTAVSQTALGQAVATFGSGCFWCTEADFDKVAGVLDTTSGFMGGTLPNPSYDMVVTGRTGYVEVLRVTYDPAKVSYKQLLDVYWRNVDPVDAQGQFCDKGSHYRPVIFAHSPEQKKLAQESKEAAAKTLAAKFRFPVVVSIEDAKPFYPAEAYHQDFYKKNANHYNRYRIGCGRDARLKQIWGQLATN